VDTKDDDTDNAIINDLKVSGNAITLNAKLVEAFLVNAFGADVDVRSSYLFSGLIASFTF
jgi:hypothetical protein